jgi:hypothetical protein
MSVAGHVWPPDIPVRPDFRRNDQAADDFKYASLQRRQPAGGPAVAFPLGHIGLKLSGWDVILPQTRHQVAKIRCRDRRVEVLGGFHD